MLRTFFIHCIVSFQGGCRSYFKMIYRYYCTFTYQRIVLRSIDDLETMIYDTIDVLKPNVKGIGHLYDRNKYGDIGNIDSILMLIYMLMNHFSI